MRWRVKSDDRGGFDELCVGEHVHLEMMDRHLLWMQVGEHVININTKTGEATHYVDAPPKKARRR